MLRHIQRLALLAILLMTGLAPLWAEDGPDTLLRARADQVFAELDKGGDALRGDFRRVFDLADRLIFPLIDFEAMAKLTLGKHWKQASDAQKQDFVKAYKELLVRTYTKSLAEYANVNIIFYPERTKYQDDYSTVYSDFVQGGGKPNIPVVYNMRKTAGGWKAFDLTIEGLSMVKNYRTSFEQEISDKGLDALIARLKKENTDA